MKFLKSKHIHTHTRTQGSLFAGAGKRSWRAIHVRERESLISVDGARLYHSPVRFSQEASTRTCVYTRAVSKFETSR